MYHYPLMKDPYLLTENRAQAIATVAENKKPLILRGEVVVYNNQTTYYNIRGLITTMWRSRLVPPQL